MTVKATAILSVQVENLGTWAVECQLDQVIKQASDKAMAKLLTLEGVKILDKPTITTIVIL